jgi:hypothetical protein
MSESTKLDIVNAGEIHVADLLQVTDDNGKLVVAWRFRDIKRFKIGDVGPFRDVIIELSKEPTLAQILDRHGLDIVWEK